MSLQVWCPLNGSLTNKGSYLQSVTATAASVNNSGKIGKCYSMSAASGNAISGVFKSNGTNLSFCIWVKFNALTHVHLLDCRINDNDGYQPMYIEPTLIQVGNGGTAFSNVSYNFTTGVWYHIAVIHTSSNTKVYVNGSLAGTVTTSRGYNYNRELPFYIGSRFTGTNPLNGLVNDFRIYDNALSASEVKSIARALCMHYPLDNNGFNSLNLITDIDTSFTSYSSGATTLFTNQMNGGIEEIVASQAGMNKCLHIRGAGNSNRVYRTWPLSQNTTYTISAYFYSSGVSSAFGAFHTELYGGGYNWEGQTVNYTTPGQWQRLSITLTPTANTTLYYFFYTNTNLDFYIKNIKLEIGSVTTPWNCGLTEYDKNTVGIREWPVSYDTTVYTESDGSKWIRILHHNNPASNKFTSSDSFTTGVYKSSDIWYDIERALGRAQRFEFMVKQKATSSDSEVKYRWVQNVNPLTATYSQVVPSAVTRNTSSGYTDAGTTYGGGLYVFGTNTRMVMANTTQGNWWGATGSWTDFNGGIPGAGSVTVTSGYMDIYLRIDVQMIEYDKSGMDNNATLNTVGMSYKGDSIRHNSSTYFNGVNDCLIIPFDASRWQTNFTMNIWFKKTQLGSKGYETLYGGPSGFEMDVRKGSESTIRIYMATARNNAGGDANWPVMGLNSWYMVTLVNDGTNEKYYVNGQLKMTIAKQSMPSGTYYLGAWASTVQQNYEGVMSDARIYATALSDSDVAALYAGSI